MRASLELVAAKIIHFLHQVEVYFPDVVADNLSELSEAISSLH